MEKRKKKARVWKWMAGVATVLCVGGIAGWFFLKKDLAKPPQQSVVKPVLSDELKKMIISASDSLYRLEFSYFDVNPDSGTGLVKDIKLIPDSAIYQKLLLAKKAPDCVCSMRTDSIVISHFSFEKTPDGKKLVISKMLIQSPDITIQYKLQPYNDAASIKDEKLLLKTMKGLLRFASVQNLLLQHINLTMINNNGSEIRKTSLRNLNIDMEDINTHTVKLTDSSRDAYTAITIGSNRITTPDGLYYLTLKDTRYAPEAQMLTIQKTTLDPRLNKTAFYQRAKFRKDRFHIINGNTIISGIDIDRLLRRQQVHLRSMTIESSYSEVYTDYNYPKRKTLPVRRHKDPHELLQQLAFDITIDTMNMHNGTFEYAIKGEKSDDVATFKMDDMEGRYVNITNNAIAKSANHYTTAHMRGRVMEGGYVTTDMRLSLTDKDGAFGITSVMGPMDGRLMNPLMKPLALIEVKSLDIQKMKTVIHGNAYGAKGNIDFYYKNMKTMFLKKDGDKREGYKKLKLISSISNLFVPDDNPKKNGKFKKGPIDIKRDAHASFFGFLWQATLEGMAVHVLGLKKE